MGCKGVIFWASLSVFASNYAASTLKICTFPSVDKDSCKALQLGNSEISCTPVSDGVDCEIALLQGGADLAVLNAEQAVLAAKIKDGAFLVLGDVRQKERRNEENAHQMVVVARRSTVTGSFSDLKNKKYCHPGFDISNHFTDLYLKSFERVVVPKTCLDNVLIQEIHDAAEFFGDSCRPGNWVQDDNLDLKLKKKYSSLCKLCNSQADCVNSPDPGNEMKTAFQCLTQKLGDIAFVSLSTVNTSMVGTDFDTYGFLCPDQTVMNLNSTKPCVWAKQPWDMVISGRVNLDVAKDLKNNLTMWLNDKKKESADKWQTVLKGIMIGESKEFIERNNSGIVTPSQYIDRGVVDRLNLSKSCNNPTIKWCTTKKLEQEKCEWLSAAAQTHGLKPKIECVQVSNLLTCLQYISTKKADIVSINTDFGFIARNIYNLSTIVFEDNSFDGNYKLIAVVRGDKQVPIRGFEDLKNKKACFPKYNGLGWLSFVNVAKERNLLGKMCPSQFFSAACAPGASYEFLLPRELPKPHLCSLCPDGNCQSASTRLERNINAMKCLDDNGDVAFINYEALMKDHKKINSSIITTNYNVLCRNGTVVNGQLDVDANCALGTGIRSEIVGRNLGKDHPETVRTSELLLELNHWFGTMNRQEGVMRMFDTFKKEDQLLFKDTTIALVQAEDSNYNMINSYKEFLSNVTRVDTCSTASIPFISSVTLILSFTVYILRLL